MWRSHWQVLLGSISGFGDQGFFQRLDLKLPEYGQGPDTLFSYHLFVDPELASPFSPQTPLELVHLDLLVAHRICALDHLLQTIFVCLALLLDFIQLSLLSQVRLACNLFLSLLLLFLSLDFLLSLSFILFSSLFRIAGLQFFKFLHLFLSGLHVLLELLPGWIPFLWFVHAGRALVLSHSSKVCPKFHILQLGYLIELSLFVLFRLRLRARLWLSGL